MGTKHGSQVVAVGLVLAGAAWLAGCELAVNSWNAEAREAWTRSYALEPNGRFELANTNGAITLEASPDAQVHVKAEKLAKAATEAAARDVLKQIEIVESAEPSLVRLETRSPRHGMFGGGSTQVTYTVQVPATAAAKLVNTNGRIELVGLEGGVDAETTNGGVRGRDLRGPVRAETTNGGVEIDLAAVHEGGVDVSTTNGGVELALPADARATVSASCTNGSIDGGDLGLDVTESTRRRLEGRQNGGGARVRAETTNGGIRFSRR
jgi:hypothetical protein